MKALLADSHKVDELFNLNPTPTPTHTISLPWQMHMHKYTSYVVKKTSHYSKYQTIQQYQLQKAALNTKFPGI